MSVGSLKTSVIQVGKLKS